MAALTIRSGLGRNLTPSEVDANFLALNTENATQQTSINSKAPLDSAALTGNPTAPTATADTNSTQIATCAFVLGQASDATPQPTHSTTASAGTSVEFARADHVHVGSGGGGSAAQNSLTPGSSTVPPSVDAVNTGLAGKADITELNEVRDELAAGLAGREAPLSFGGLAVRTGNVVTVDPPKVTGRLIRDAGHFYLLPGATGFSSLGSQVGALTTNGTYSAGSIQTVTPVNAWNSIGRAGYIGTAGAAHNVRVGIQPRVRFPHTTSGPTYGGFKCAFTYAVADSLTSGNSRTWFGFLQNAPSSTAGTEPSAFTGAKIGFRADSTEANLQLISGSTVLKDLGSNFPANGNETYPYLVEFECFPEIAGAPRYMTWRITNILTGITDSGTIASANLPEGSFEPFLLLWRENTTTSGTARFFTTGAAAGAWLGFVVGDSSGMNPTPIEFASSAALNPLLHADVSIRMNSASAAVLTIGTGFSNGQIIFGSNLGAGLLSFAAASGVTIHKHADVPDNLEQRQGFSFECIAPDTFVRFA